MFFSNKITVFFLFYILGNMTFLFAQPNHKKYDIKSGMIFYTISGGGQLTQEVNLTIKGKGKLRFKDWGEVELIEEEIEEITSGALKNIEIINKCEKLQKKQQLDVDFKAKKILERSLPQGNVAKNITMNMVKQGQEVVAGQTCDIWEGYGVRTCIYKGIPLLMENYLLGVYYQKKASYITFDINTSSSNCSIPDYPIEKFAFFKTNIKTKSKKLPKEFSKVLMSVAKDMHRQVEDNKISEEDLTLQQKRIWLDKIGQNIFEKQKKLLPKMLLSMKKARECLERAENWITANECLVNVIHIKSQFTKNKDSNIESWKDDKKVKYLNTFDENIALLESKMKCIRAAKNITDLSTCMK